MQEVPKAAKSGRSGRLVALGCLAVIVLSFVLDPVNPSWGIVVCPFKQATGLPCPGCGITRAIVCVGHGRLAESVKDHPLGPIAWLAAAAGASTLILPGRWKARLADWYRRRRTRIEKIILVGVVLLTLFGVLRIVFLYVPGPRWWLW